MARIFISYRRADSAGYAGRLYDHLGNHFGKNHVFMDVDSINPGVDFVDAIDQAVGQCDAVVAVIGRQWVSITDSEGRRRIDDPNDFVRIEIETALNRNILLIPVLVDNAPTPLAGELPPSLAKLVRRNALEVSNTRFRYDVDKLIRTIEQLIPSPSVATVAQKPAIPTRKQAVRHSSKLPTVPPAILQHIMRILIPTLIIALTWAIIMGTARLYQPMVRESRDVVYQSDYLGFGFDGWNRLGFIGGLAIALVLRWIVPTLKWRHLALIVISWLIGFFVTYDYEYPAFSAGRLMGAAGIGGLGTAIILFFAKPALRWRTLIIFLGWFVCFWASFYWLNGREALRFSDPWLRILPAFEGAAIGAGIMFWQLSTLIPLQSRTT